MKRILFYENTDVTNVIRNQRLRYLDQSWRLQEDNNPRHTGVLDAILYARVKYRAGEGEELYMDADQPVPTRIWLGELPGRPGATRPALRGNLNQDTYVRILVPVRALILAATHPAHPALLFSSERAMREPRLTGPAPSTIESDLAHAGSQRGGNAQWSFDYSPWHC